MTPEEQHQPDDPITLSWDAASPNAPERPAFSSSIAEQAAVTRPRRVLVSTMLAIVGVVVFIALTALAVARFNAIRDGLVAALPEDLADYSDADVDRAIHLLLAVVAGIGVVLAIVILLSVLRLTFKRSKGARTAMVISSVLFVPAAVLALVVQEVGDPELVGGGAAVLCVVVAAILACTPAVSAWLQHDDRQRPVPLVSPDGRPE